MSARGARPELIVLPDADALADEAARRIEAVAVGARPDGPATVALAGGSTPKVAYRHLSARPVPWARLRLFYGDERCVPPDDPGSNHRMVCEEWLDRVPLPPGNVHRIPGELEPEEAARRAEGDLRRSFGTAGVPRLDLVILGIGADGHTASLFPGGPELEVADRLMVPVHRPGLPQPWRVSMTLPVLNAARRVLFLAADGAKADVVARAVAGDPAIPAGRVRPADGTLTWMLTEAAAARIG